jgi:hypothetical protein
MQVCGSLFIKMAYIIFTYLSSNLRNVPRRRWKIKDLCIKWYVDNLHLALTKIKEYEKKFKEYSSLTWSPIICIVARKTDKLKCLKVFEKLSSQIKMACHEWTFIGFKPNNRSHDISQTMFRYNLPIIGINLGLTILNKIQKSIFTFCGFFFHFLNA